MLMHTLWVEKYYPIKSGNNFYIIALYYCASMTSPIFWNPTMVNPMADFMQVCMCPTFIVLY